VSQKKEICDVMRPFEDKKQKVIFEGLLNCFETKKFYCKKDLIYISIADRDWLVKMSSKEGETF
jgi:hypothetical protein